MPEYTSNVGGADPRVTDPLDRHVRSLTRIAEADFSKAWPGHRAPINDPTTRARDVIDHHRRRARRILELLDSTDPMTTWAVADALFGELNHVHIFIGPGEAHAHLDYLDRHGFVAQATDGYRRTDRPAAALESVFDSEEAS